MNHYAIIQDKSSIYRTLFFKIFTVTEYASTEDFMAKDSVSYEIWKEMAIKKYDAFDDEIYFSKACYLPEFSKIVGVTYANVFNDGDGNMSREINKIYVEDEKEIIERFFKVIEYLYESSGEAILCGHNISTYDIPFLVKRALKHNIPLPVMLKKTLSAKPWESCVIDTMNVWKFNGFETMTSLKNIANFLGLKYKTLPIRIDEQSNKYWNSKLEDKWYEYETANQVNLTMQLIRKLRDL